ncbi:hypothetical protein CPC08DRAFT_822616 [Agrocybe pediades]|nr:hypothetical protein CPC08DRAFT_822616 [Agrocybe pediades]
MRPFISISWCFYKEDPADEAYDKGLRSYERYMASHKPEYLHDTIQNFQSCLDLRLETRRDSRARREPDSPDLSEKIVRAYLMLTMALLSQYEKQPTLANLQHLARVEPNLFMEWGTKRPRNYIYLSMLYNVATAYNRAYLQAISQPPPSPTSPSDPANDTWSLSPIDLYQRAHIGFGQIPHALNAESGMSGMSSMRGMALSRLANLEVLRYYERGATYALDTAISYFKEAVQSFSILPKDRLLLRECLDILATAYYRRFEIDPARNHQDLDNSISYYRNVQSRYNEQHGAEKMAWIKCSHHLATALYKRYEINLQHNHPGPVGNGELPANRAALEDLKNAHDVGKEAKNVLDALTDDIISRLGLRETKEHEDKLWGVLAQHSTHTSAQSSRQPSPTPSSNRIRRKQFKASICCW